MRLPNNCTLLCLVLLFFVFVNTSNAESRQIHTPARVLAKQTGATQFEEERYETHADCNEHKHHLKKRASDEDVDYEVYQGVVGRPGIDFPIYPRIPKTSFSCRSFGNGYFADMDTDCQVFHICEEGRKISFLCPNGTIFQQSELTCDWWFKVNCLGSPGYYAESAEILSKQRHQHQRVRPSVPVKGFNIVGGGLNIKPITPKVSSVQTRTRNGNKSERRIDSSEQQPSIENVDFEDISGEKPLKGQTRKIISNIDNNSNDNESQITAETSSFVSGRNRNSYVYENPHDSRNKNHNSETVSEHTTHTNNNDHGNGNGSGSENLSGFEIGQRKSFTNPSNTNTNTESIERSRSGQRGQQRFKDDKKSATTNYDQSKNNEKTTKSPNSKSKALPEKIIEISSRNIGGKADIAAESDAKPEYYETTKRVTNKPSSTTQFHSQGTYSTARKLDSPRTTPYYTPTVPSVVKAKSTEGKSYYVKGKGGYNVVATTPNPNRLNNGNNAGSNLRFESSISPKTSTTTTTTTTTATSFGPSGETVISTLGTTFRPFIIGMRHSHDGDLTSAEIQRISVNAKKSFAIDDTPLKKVNKKFDSREYLPTTTPAPTGPTYLPKSAATLRGVEASAGDDFLFAPNPVADDTVSRNLDEMLKTMNLLKSKLTDSEEEVKGTGPARLGLEIPPSSGPDVLISLAKYFATEQSTGSSVNSVDDKDIKKPNAKQVSNARPSASKPSDTTATLTTAATPRVSVKNDDIKTSLLSQRTVEHYTSLFGLNGDYKLKSIEHSQPPNKTGPSAKNKSSEVTRTPFPQIGSTDATIRELAQKPESRRIAQVFSNALSTYLDDPKSFRQQLQSVRPTEPPTAGVETFTPNFTPVTDKENLLFKSGTGATYLPTKPTTAAKILSTTTQSTIAAEINDKFDYSTPFPELTSTTDVVETTTYRPAHGAFDKKHKFEFSAELAPPNTESSEGEEFLHREQTQSFVKSRNELTSQSSAKKAGKASGAYISAAKPTENPWNSISQTDYIDPLTINDGLMRETKTTTFSPFTYLPKDTTTTQKYTTVRAQKQELPIINQGRNIGSRFSVGSAEVTTQRNRYEHVQNSDSWRDILNTYDLPEDTLPSSNGLQRIANRLFGGLNESEALHLKNVMQQAEHNRQVLRLLLLLIQTCDDQNGKALERSRKHLLNALIDMDSKLNGEKTGKVSHEKSNAAITTTHATIITTTSKRKDTAGNTSTVIYPSSATDLPTTTKTITTTGNNEETTKFEIRVEDPEEDQVATASTLPANSHSSSDRRALELLKSLYSLASKFNSRR